MSFGAAPPGMDEYQRLMAERAAAAKRKRNLFALIGVAVVGGGCSGFSYKMAFENQVNEASDNVYEFDGLKVLVDQMSEMYLDGISIDYIETLEGAGFKFNNPNVKSTCGCGSSFTV